MRALLLATLLLAPCLAAAQAFESSLPPVTAKASYAAIEFMSAGDSAALTSVADTGAGVYVFGGGIDERVLPVLVSANGTTAEGGYSWAPPLNGGFLVLELPSREEAIAWAARIAKACRCDQELRMFGFDPKS